MSALQLLVGGRPVGKPIKVFTRPLDTVAQVLGAVPAASEAFLFKGEHFLVVDTASFAAAADDEDGVLGAPIPEGTDALPGEGGRCPPRSFFGPGWVEWWRLGGPWALEPWSVMPERVPSFSFPRWQEQDADAVCHPMWGGRALKIADSCTYRAGENLCCCNRTAIRMLGIAATCRTTRPENEGWPACPDKTTPKEQCVQRCQDTFSTCIRLGGSKPACADRLNLCRRGCQGR